MKKKCLLCKKKNFKTFYKINSFPTYFGAIPQKSYNKIKKFPLEISYCNKCSLVQQTKIINEKYMNEVYSSQYYNCPTPKKNKIGRREVNKFLKFFSIFKIKKKKILEIGSFDGYLLDKISKNNEVYGCDPSHEAKLLKKKYGNKRIKNVFYKKGVFRKKEFDVIIFRNLLEHIYDIRSFLKAVMYSLKDSGHIFIDVPNVKAIVESGSLGVFFHQHISYFSKNTITYTLNNNGFDVLKIYEGNPNLFVYAIKNKKNNSLKIQNSDQNFLKKNIIKSNKIKEKIIKIFCDKSNSRIVLFGMSALATTIVNFLPNKLRDKIVLLCDNDKEKHGKILCGYNKKITHPKSILKIDYDKLIICSYFFKKEIIQSISPYIKSKQKIILL